MKCEIIKDLLPLYIDHLTSDESNREIEQHVSQCKECNNELMTMQRSTEIPSQNFDESDVKPYRKYNKRMLLLKISIGLSCLFIVAFLIYFYSIKYRGSTLFCIQTIDSSSHYSEEEIKDAISEVKDSFDEFEGFILTSIEYDDEYSESTYKEWADEYGAKEAIVLCSTEYMVPWAEYVVTKPGTTENWHWILVRNSGEEWELKTWGY